MDTQSIIAALEDERDRLDRAIAALQRSQGTNGRKGSRSLGRGRRRLSAAARKRISDAMKKRWAARKKAAQSK